MRKRRLKMAVSSRDACPESRPDFFPCFYPRLRCARLRDVLNWIHKSYDSLTACKQFSQKPRTILCLHTAVWIPPFPSCDIMDFFFWFRVRDDFDRRPTSAYHSCYSWMLMWKVNNAGGFMHLTAYSLEWGLFIMHWILDPIRFLCDYIDTRENDWKSSLSYIASYSDDIQLILDALRSNLWYVVG